MFLGVPFIHCTLEAYMVATWSQLSIHWCLLMPVRLEDNRLVRRLLLHMGYYLFEIWLAAGVSFMLDCVPGSGLWWLLSVR